MNLEPIYLALAGALSGFVLACVVVAVVVKFRLTILRMYADILLYGGVIAGFEVAVRMFGLKAIPLYAQMAVRAELFLAVSLLLKTVLLLAGFAVSRFFVKQIAAFAMQTFEVISLVVVLALLVAIAFQRPLYDVLAMIGFALVAVGFLSKDYLNGIAKLIKLARDPNVNVGDWITIEGRTGKVEEFTVDGVLMRSSLNELVVVGLDRFVNAFYVNHSQLGGQPYMVSFEFEVPAAIGTDRVKQVFDGFFAIKDNAAKVTSTRLSVTSMEAGQVRYRSVLGFKDYESNIRDFGPMRTGLYEQISRLVSQPAKAGA
ncbi:MAG: mechanosensitive ion channel [Alphaproteobacteria bacterium]|nr:mechanosensitive ion channel [Alphaproteobacteria bacterium]